MSEIYRNNVAHGALIGDKHTWRDWRLVPKNKLVVAKPDLPDNGITVPGRNGDIYSRKAMTGDVVYGTRKGTWEFRVENRNSTAVVYSEILDYIHGQELTVILDDDRYFYYKGELQVDDWTPEQVRDTLRLHYKLQPFKMERDSSLEPWLWDPFDFEQGIIRDYGELTVDGTLELVIPGRRLQVCPGIYATGTVSVTYGGATYTLVSGKWNYFDAICLGEGEHTLLFTGDGTVSVDYRGGRL